MKKIISLIITFVLLTLIFTCNGYNPEEATKNTSVDNTQITYPKTTAISETEAVTEAETETITEAENEPAEYVDVPNVVTADKYEKEAVDTLGYGLQFTHTVEIPEIDSDKPGATSLNETIYSAFADIIKELKTNNEEKYLYRISYTSSAAEGILCIRVITYVGIQYSEGGYWDFFYYYDAQKDLEVTMTEYLSHFGYDLDFLSGRSLFCDEYFFAGEYPYGVEGLSYTEERGEFSENPTHDKLSFAAVIPDRSCEMAGCEVTEDIIRTYFINRAYITSIFSCELYRDSLEPVYPIYAALITPETNSDTEGIIINFDNGNVIFAAANPVFLDLSVFVTSSAVICDYKRSDTGYHPLKTIINGKEAEYPNYIDYIKIEDLKSIEILPAETKTE